MFRIQRVASYLFLCLLGWTQSSPAQISSSQLLFAPGDRVPLSKFKQRLMSTGTTTLNVDPDILNWIYAPSQGSTVKIAIKASGIQYVAPGSVNLTNGDVTYSGPKTGTCVVVSDDLTQDLDIESHWDASLNWDPVLMEFRGGWALGATDGIKTIDYNLTAGELEQTGSIQNTSSAHAHLTAGMYDFVSDRYALFSDQSGLHVDALVPAYEVYVAETYSLSHVTPLAAIALSDQTLQATGFPVAHRNGTKAFTSSTPGEMVEDGLPLFQVVHCHLIDVSATYDLNDDFPGSENSLGSFILPPSWTSAAPVSTYPILFNGFYDIQSSMFFSEGPGFFEALGGLYRHPEQRLAVGLLWNGGGASATYTTQRSAYDNANQLIQDAATLLQADPERVVFTGSSRGGITALEMGSNPYDFPYTTRFIHASNGNSRLGDIIDTTSPTYYLGMQAFGGVTGYSEAWKSGWTDPDTGLTVQDLTKRNAFNTTVTAEVNALCPDSTAFLARLEEEGAEAGGLGVVFRNGTHDHSRPLVHAVEYAHNLRDLDPAKVSLQLELFYRAGHNRRVTDPDNEALLNKVFDDDPTLDTVTRFYAADPSDPEGFFFLDPDPMTGVGPFHVPLVYETPLLVGSGQFHTWEFVGAPGARIRIKSAKMPVGWFPGDPLPDPFPTLVTVSETVLSAPPGKEFGTAQLPVSVSIPSNRFWWYEADYSPDGDTTYEETYGQDDFAPPPGPATNGEPVVYISASETVGLNIGARTGGLAGDAKLVPKP